MKQYTQEAWLRFLPGCREAHHIREIMNANIAHISKKDIHSLFYKQIDKLLGSLLHEHTRSSLLNLREDLEEAIEKAGDWQSREVLYKRKKKEAKKYSILSSVLVSLNTIRDELNRIEIKVRSEISED